MKLNKIIVDKNGEKKNTKIEEKEGEKRRQLNGEYNGDGVSYTSKQIFENQADIWLTTKEAADYLRISPKCLLNLTSNGKIQYFKFGRRNRFLLKNLNKALLSQPRGSSYGN